MKKWLTGFILGIGISYTYTCYYVQLPSHHAAAPLTLEAKSRQVSQQVASQLEVNADGLLRAAEQTEQGKNEAFGIMVYQLGDQINGAVASSLNLTPEAKQEMNQLLVTNYPEIAQKAREDYLNGIKTLKPETAQSMSSARCQTRAEILSVAINSTVCQFANLIFIPMRVNLSLSSNIVAGYVMADPCSYLLNGVTVKVGQQLYRTALIRDLETTQMRLTLQKQSALAQLTTYEMVFKVDAKQILQRSIGRGSWVLAKWVAARLSIRYQASVKYGYDLTKNFEITRNDKERLILIRLPPPELMNLSLEPEVTDADDGGIPDLTNSNFRAVFQQAQQEAIRQAELRNIKSKAVEEAQVILACIFEPFTRNTTYGYQLRFING